MRRLRRETLLDSSSRKRILNIIERRPGAHVARVAREARLSWSGAKQHLVELERDGFVRSVVVRQRRVYVITDAFEATALRALVSDAARDIAEHLLAAEPVTARAIAAGTGRSRRVVYHHVAILRREGLLVTEGEPFVVRSTPKLRALVHAS